MGGLRETTLEAEKSAKSSKGGKSAKAGGVRIHENAGEVHFHDDASGLKVGMPVATWYQAWSRISCQPQVWGFADKKNNARLEVETRLSDGVMDAIATLSPLGFSDNFTELDNFTLRK